MEVPPGRMPSRLDRASQLALGGRQLRTGPIKSATDLQCSAIYSALMSVRKFIVGMLAVALLLYGPINHSWPFWLAIRGAYLIGIPTLTWFALLWVWHVWDPSWTHEDRLVRVLSGFVAAWFLAEALRAIRMKHHFMELASGDNVRIEGPDWFGVLLWGSFAACAVWFGIRYENRTHRPAEREVSDGIWSRETEP